MTSKWVLSTSICVYLRLTAPLLAQNAEISGLITDPSGLAVPNARVTAENPGTSATRTVSSNQQGAYNVRALLPGSYNIRVEAMGFKAVHQNGVVVEVEQRAWLNFVLTIGSNTESIIVQGNAPLLNTSDASVSTVIGNRFVENMPLNGRSFSSLIDLAPGVVLTRTNNYDQGQFSVNGQRPDTNYFMIDGVSANLGAAGGALGQSGAGQLPTTSAFGGTSNLVSLDALEEFRIQTSTFAPEYGRTPGAQISVVTKSGTNTFHGTAFEYFRNDKLDANDWFANANALARPELRQNDFGGVLGGPMKKDKLFFLGSYEGLRLRQPRVGNTYVPSLVSRQSAPTGLQPLLNAFPLPNGPDLGNGTAAFAASYSDPSMLNSYGIRTDYLLSPTITILGRYSDAPSNIEQRGGGARLTTYSNIAHVDYRAQSLTLGSNQALTPRLANEFRFNYSRSRVMSFYTVDNFGGAVPPPDSALFPSFTPPPNSAFAFFGDLNPYGLKFYAGPLATSLQRQVNLIDNVSLVVGAHQVKFGLDYRRLTPEAVLVPYQLQYVFSSLSNILANNVPQSAINSSVPVEMVFSNWSLFAQDTWKATRTWTITYGVRWEYDPAPSANGQIPFTVTGVENPATMKLAPPGTPLWHPQKGDFAPRVGAAWQPLPNLVLRAGAGVFYDLGYSSLASLTSLFPYVQTKVIPNTSFPLTAANAAPLPYTTSPPVSFLEVVDPNHVLPKTYEWNAAVEKAVGNLDVFDVTYVGAASRKLTRMDILNAPNPQFTGQVYLIRNAADSSYQSLQAQYRHRMAYGLQTLLSYTWGHSIDDASSDANFVNVPMDKSPSSRERGSSDHDIRQTFSGAISYDIPARGSRVWKSVFGNWSTDSIVYARTAPPVNVVTGVNPFPGTSLAGANSAQRPDLAPGVPLWIADSNVAGGKRINKAAFVTPAGPVQGNLGRNAMRGFGATQVDLTLRRQFLLRERLSLQARADFFNIFNHPNFGPPTNYMSSPLFGQSTQMLGASLGSGGQNGGLNPLYQIGGPRSAQLALKLIF